ncbi:hypothetical protein SLEP1_g57251 [Rubroshorea leprosula]|uniref:Secreted protein n=1 Tax=Rubroshorea leprosula TaxID=152421 RepID=A0AAV5MN29_9ROSI|nr:hypothetical protein SLEP1_g57251 [Rubroshorea leprosula]
MTPGRSVGFWDPFWWSFSCFFFCFSVCLVRLCLDPWPSNPHADLPWLSLGSQIWWPPPVWLPASAS